MTGAAAPRDERRVLTVLHAPERTGPPLFALRYLHWLREQRPEWHTDTLFLDGAGDLVPAFEDLGEVLVEPGWSGSRSPNRGDVRRVRRRLRDRCGPIDLAHVHCAGSMAVMPLLSDVPVLCHLHELSVGLDFHLSRPARRHLTDARRYVAVSDAVRTEFLTRFDTVPPGRVEQQWGFVDGSTLAVQPDLGALGADRSELVVVSAGVRHWRKAPGLFLRVAHRARVLHPDRRWRFVWVGGGGGGGGATDCARLAQRDGLGDVVEFIDHIADPLPLLAAADVFLHTAREDAFPLVCVEAAALGRPIVSFENGGAAELIRRSGCGRVVPFPDVDAMVGALAHLADEPAERKALGARAADFAAAHLVLDRRGPGLLDTMERTMVDDPPG